MHKVSLYFPYHTIELTRQYGRQFSLDLQFSDPPPSHVPKRVTSKLAVFVPGKELVDAYLSEIAKGYGVAWTPELEPLSADKQEAELGDGEKIEGDKKDDEDVDRGLGGSSGNDDGGSGGDEKEVNLPDSGPEKDAWASGAEVKLPSAPVEKKMTPEEELAKRFERLKQLR